MTRRRRWRCLRRSAGRDAVPALDATCPMRACARRCAQARAMLFPSGGEGFGIPPMEALHAGLPVIVSASLPALVRVDRMRWAGAAADSVTPESIAAAVRTVAGRRGGARGLWDGAATVAGAGLGGLRPAGGGAGFRPERYRLPTDQSMSQRTGKHPQDARYKPIDRFDRPVHAGEKVGDRDGRCDVEEDEGKASQGGDRGTRSWLRG